MNLISRRYTLSALSAPAWRKGKAHIATAARDIVKMKTTNRRFRPCRVCADPEKRAAVESTLHSGEGQLVAATVCGLPINPIQNHLRRCIPEQIPAIQAASRTTMARKAARTIGTMARGKAEGDARKSRPGKLVSDGSQARSVGLLALVSEEQPIERLRAGILIDEREASALRRTLDPELVQRLIEYRTVVARTFDQLAASQLQDILAKAATIRVHLGKRHLINLEQSRRGNRRYQAKRKALRAGLAP